MCISNKKNVKIKHTFQHTIIIWNAHKVKGKSRLFLYCDSDDNVEGLHLRLNSMIGFTGRLSKTRHLHKHCYYAYNI